jgi:hypothetical protein
MAAIADCSPTNDAAGPSATSHPLANPQSTATSTEGTAACPASEPSTIETAMHRAAHSITLARLRYAPWNEPNPTDTAPIAPNTPIGA